MTKGRGGGVTPKRVVELMQVNVAQFGQSAVARDTGLTRQTVQRYMKGIGEPSQATIEKLATYFDVTVTYLRGDTSSDKPDPDWLLELASLIIGGFRKEHPNATDQEIRAFFMKSKVTVDREESMITFSPHAAGNKNKTHS